MKERIYRYDNVKAFLIFLVVVGHMTSDYVSDSMLVRQVTLWIYMFHMPAFIFISGLVHKQYINEARASLGVRGETHLRSDKLLGFFLCGFALKVFLQFSRTLMEQNPIWKWFEEPGIPWYLFVMAEYELLFYLIRYIDGGGSFKDADGIVHKLKGLKPQYVIAIAFAISAIIGYFPAVGDTLCLARMINFLPIYMLGYYADLKKFNAFIKEHKNTKFAAWVIIAITLILCYFGDFKMYGLRKVFTGRRSYEYLADYVGSVVLDWGWAARLLAWAFALILSLAIIAVIPDRDLGFVTTIGARTLNVYFWHRPLCYLFRNWMVLPKLHLLFGGTYKASVAGVTKGMAFGGSPWSMLAALIVYILIGALMTALFSLKIFEHPCSDLMKLAALPFKREAQK